MKRSLPMEFFQPSNNYSMTKAPIYDNNARFSRKNTPSPNKQIRKVSLPTNGHDISVANTGKRSPFIEVLTKDKQNKTVK
jgi:hypothetical protein